MQDLFTARTSLAAVLALILSLSACVTSDLQSARLVGPGKFEVTPSYTMASFSGDGQTERTTNQFEDPGGPRSHAPD